MAVYSRSSHIDLARKLVHNEWTVVQSFNPPIFLSFQFTRKRHEKGMCGQNGKPRYPHIHTYPKTYIVIHKIIIYTNVRMCMWVGKKNRNVAKILWFYLAIINVLWIWNMWTFLRSKTIWIFQSHFNLIHCTCRILNRRDKISSQLKIEEKKCISSLVFVSGKMEKKVNLISYMTLLNFSLFWINVDVGVKFNVINNVLTRYTIPTIEKEFFLCGKVNFL